MNMILKFCLPTPVVFQARTTASVYVMAGSGPQGLGTWGLGGTVRPGENRLWE